MKLIITTILLAGALLALAVTGASAQSSFTMTGGCKATSQQTIPAGDQPDHVLAVSRGTCSAKQTVGGATSTSGAYAERDDITATHLKGSGIYTVTYSTGDKVFYQYDVSFVTKDGNVVSGTGAFTAVGGTGKMKGISAKGTCTFRPGADPKTNNYSCTGQYTLAGGN